MMRYQITADWNIAGGLLKAGTVVDTSAQDCPVKGQTIPLTARPLDEDAWQAQLAAYPDAKHLFPGGWA